MVKKKGPAWNFFKQKNKGVECKYCCKVYKHSNVNKMANHIKKCFKCPADMKKILDNCNILKPLQTARSTSKRISEQEADLSTDTEPGSSSSSMPVSRNTFSSELMQNEAESLLQSSSTSSKRSLGLQSFMDHMDTQTNVSILIYFSKL